MGSVATGVLGGAATGASMGSMVMPGWGTAIGAVAGGIVGGIDSSNKQKAQDEAMERLNAIPAFDPMQLDFLDLLKREKRAVESGFTTDFQVAKDLNMQMMAGGLSVAESVGATNPALAFSLSRRVTADANIGINQALGTISSRGMGLTNSMGELINKISQRKLDLEMVKTSQQLGIATDALKTNQINANQWAATLPEYTDDFKFSKQPVAARGVGDIEPWMTQPWWLLAE